MPKGVVREGVGGGRRGNGVAFQFSVEGARGPLRG